ncbi:Hint domain-containing protein [Yoonia sp. I 8.24]|uniref:Hint domain-containing protein n=1 Tax=Yoonia sp. I 8.24 TaxID=1537229 RepID=UPI001EDD7505|nr:Hint domain-containing protein [Yoonia sp. I 8.24]MCG3269317.1 Hint domain-containing protein [Yoonia sp. I 8.24]
MITDYSDGATGTFTVDGVSVGYTVSNDNTISPTSTSDGLTWGSVRFSGEDLTVDFDTHIDEAVIYIADFNNAESIAITLDGVVIDLNDAIADGAIEIISLHPDHSINPTSGELEGSGSAASISSFRIKTGFDSFGISDTGAGDAAPTQVRFSIEADINTTTVCFARGTLIQTDDGEVPVETLQEGTLVKTLDEGFLPLRWIGSCAFDSIDLTLNPKLKPIRIRSGALGENIPKQDLLVSRQHRVLVRSAIAQRMFGTDEVLIPAVKLLALDGIDTEEGSSASIEYFHILFDTHQIVFSNGMPTESLLTGPEALKSVSPTARKELQEILPRLKDEGGHPIPARHVPPHGKRIKKLVDRHQANNKPVYSA